ncbi:saposin domain-containing protein [Streptomyces sp. AB3(2024)]|uniref:saposin domain-containing protein n=1 Tax=Streptomyces sp. AB3(2024) TaxID=3317321 RepID=UPI0035A36D2B
MTSNAPCELYVQMVQHLKDNLTSTTTKEEAQELLLSLAKNSGSFEGQATSFVTDNSDEIFEFLASEMEPLAVCIALDVCPSQ